MVGNQGVTDARTDGRPAFDEKSLERDGTLIRSEGHLGEFTVPIWKQYDQWLWR